MNKLVKGKMIGSIICLVISVGIFVYTLTFGKTLNEELHSYLNGFAGGMFGVGIVTTIISINALKNPSKARELENSINDERLKSINNCAMANVCRICIILQAVSSVVCAIIGKMEVAKYLGFAICFELIIYIIMYSYLKSKN